MRGPQATLQVGRRVADLAMPAIVEKIDVSAHKSVTLLPPACLVVASPCPAAPCPALPSRAQPCRENVALLTARALVCALPCRAQPRPAPPCRASPRRAVKVLHLFPPGALVVDLPCPASPCRAPPGPATPRKCRTVSARASRCCLAAPRRAAPRPAVPRRAVPRREIVEVECSFENPPPTLARGTDRPMPPDGLLRANAN
jgi:hypothetical protein